uniref:Uncharacterized protein n=1 Tax=Vitis vinifera TaxID=29760 RepID=F6HG85_VITVI
MYALDVNLCPRRLYQLESERMSTQIAIQILAKTLHGNASSRFQPLSLCNSKMSANGGRV